MKKNVSPPYPIGHTIVGVTTLDREALASMGWRRSPLVLVRDDDGQLFVSRDEEGNGPGVLTIGQHGSHEILSAEVAANLYGMVISRISHESRGGWRKVPVVLQLSGGFELVPQSDEEGNDVGCWFGTNNQGDFVLAAGKGR